jgi:hypothetical protein
MEGYTGCDELVHEQEIRSLMKLTEISLRPFLDEEPDLYFLGDVKVIPLK